MTPRPDVVRRCRVVVAALALLPALAARPATAAFPPADAGSGGAVAAAEADARDAGLELLRAGGNAVDAAVAVALALAVVHPEAGNLGGGGFAVARIGGDLVALDFRESAPAAARPDMYLDAAGRVVENASLVGPLATGVPGSPSGYFELHRRFGRLPWARVVAPALRLARDGFVVSERLHRALAAARHLLARFPETAAVWLADGAPAPAGTRVALPSLAATLAAYAEQGPRAITEGPVAAAVVAASSRHGGVLTAADLAAYRPVWREPLRFTCFGWDVAGMPLPSSGGVIMAQSCAVLERLDWAAAPRFGAVRAHLLAEAWRRAYADRMLLGDPATSRVRLSELLAPSWLARRAAGIDRSRATPSRDVASFPGAAARESDQTTHLSVVDADGNAVALTTTLNGSFGCGLLVPEAGFLLNNEMDDFATAPGVPNLFGLIQGEANAVAPGRRMLSSMSPTLAWRGGELLVLGGRGGSRIPTATLQALLALIVDGDDALAAVSRARLHHQWLPDELAAEPDTLSPETAAALTALGHRLVVAETLAKVLVVRRRADGRCEAAADPRGPGAAGVVAAVGAAPAPLPGR